MNKIVRSTVPVAAFALTAALVAPLGLSLGNSAASAAQPSALPGATTVDVPHLGFRALNSPDPAAVASINKPYSVELDASHVPGLDASKAVVLRNTAQTSIALAPAGANTCAMRFDASGFAPTICADAATAASRGIVGGVPGRWFAVLPDGVNSVAFALRGGGTQVKSVIANYVEGPTDTVGLTYVNAGTTYNTGTLASPADLSSSIVLPPK